MDEKLQLPGHAEHLVDADPDPHRDALDGHPQRRSASRCSATTSPTIERAAVAIERALAAHARARAARSPSASTGGFYLDFELDREAAARHGLRVGGRQRGRRDRDRRHERLDQTVEGRERYPISVRYARDFRDDPEALGRVLVATPDGAQVPLAQVADDRLRRPARR